MRRNRVSGAALLLFGALLPISACGESKRDFGGAPSAGTGGADAGGQSASGGSSASGAGTRGVGASGAESSGAEAGASEAGSSEAGSSANGASAGLAEAGGGEAGARGSGGAPPATECVPLAQRSCAEAGLLGSCAQGTQVCGSDGNWGACSVTPKAKDSCVTGNDDSCNGIANEGCGCVVGAERTCVGAQGNCATGKQTCPDGTWSACSIAPKAQDACTPGDDANCNGKPNEGCSCTDGATQSCGPAAVGICKPGKSSCSSGAWGACLGAVVAAARDCRSSADNDCNGVADNTVDAVCQCNPTQPQACGTHSGLDGKGICKAGTETCNAASNNASSSWGSCTGSVAPATRNCSSSADNDCNGVADNTIDGVCLCKPTQQQACGTHSGLDGKGICKAGTETCNAASNNASSSWGGCTGSVGPAARNCGSSADNDCNGVADNTIDSVCQCNPSSATSCTGGAKCKSSGSTSQCVACLANADCNNGTCNSGNTCACTAGYNGSHCEFLAFQGTGVGADVNSFVYNVSHDGSIVVGYSQATDGAAPRHAFRWVNGTWTAIAEPGSLSGSFGCYAQAVDSNGTIVGTCEDTVFQFASGTVTLISLSPDTGSAGDVSKDGKVLVGTTAAPNNGGLQAFRRVGTTVTPIPKLGTDFSEAYAVSGDGSVVVGDEYIFYHVGWFWTSKSGTVQLPQLSSGFDNYDPADVSTDGTVVVGYSDDGYAIRWSGTSFSQIQTTANSAYASTNQDGSVSVGHLIGSDEATSAAVWDANGVHQLTDLLSSSNLTGWTLTDAVGVSDDGKVVVGTGTHAGRYEGWVAHLP